MVIRSLFCRHRPVLSAQEVLSSSCPGWSLSVWPAVRVWGCRKSWAVNQTMSGAHLLSTIFWNVYLCGFFFFFTFIWSFIHTGKCEESSLPPHHHSKLLPNKNNLCADRRDPRPLCSWRGRRAQQRQKEGSVFMVNKISWVSLFRQNSGLKPEPTAVAWLSGLLPLFAWLSSLHFTQPASTHPPPEAIPQQTAPDGERNVSWSWGFFSFSSRQSVCAVNLKVERLVFSVRIHFRQQLCLSDFSLDVNDHRSH